MKTHKAYKINSEARRIDEVEVGDYRDIQHAIGCDRFDVAAYLDDNDALYVDDEGYLNPHVKTGFFYCQQFFAGNGLLVGADEEGESADVKISELLVAQSINFPPSEFEISDSMRDEAMNSWAVTEW